MARVKFSPIISSINGKLGNAVFQGGRSGAILREKVKPINRKTEKQVAARNRLSGIKAIWQGLTTTEKDSWISFANFFKQSTKHNITKFLSAYELFIQANTIRTQGPFDALLETTFQTEALEGGEAEVRLFADNTLRVDLAISPQTVITNGALYVSKPFKQSQHIAKSEVRFIQTYLNDGGFLDITDIYLNIFKRLPQAGEKVLVKGIGFLDNSGWTSKPLFLEDTIVQL